MKRISCVFLSLVLFFSLCTPFAEAKEESSSTCVVSKTAVAEAVLDAISDTGLNLSDSDYDLIRQFVKTTEPTAVTTYFSYFDLDEELMLVVNQDRSIELHKGPWVIKDSCDAWLTIDNAYLAEPDLPVFGFAGSTWVLDSVYDVIRKWTLGEEEFTVPMSFKAEISASQISVSVYEAFTNDSDHCYLYNDKGELAMMDSSGNITPLASDYAYFIKQGVARLENSLYYINSKMQLVHINLLTKAKTVFKYQATALDFSIVARYYDGETWKSIPSYVNTSGKKTSYVVPSDFNWLIGTH